MFRQACIAGISPLEFDEMELWQVIAAIRGYDERMKLQAKVQDALCYKLIMGMNMGKPRMIPFEQLFPGWCEQHEPAALTQEEIALRNARRLDAWADEEV